MPKNLRAMWFQSLACLGKASYTFRFAIISMAWTMAE